MTHFALAVVIVNVLGYYDPLRALIKGAIAAGFIKPRNERLVIFIDCPPGIDATCFDWGNAALAALEAWAPPGPGIFRWHGNITAKVRYWTIRVCPTADTLNNPLFHDQRNITLTK